MKKRLVEIIGNHPSLVKGDKKNLPVIVCKALVKSGMAKYADEEPKKQSNQKSVENGKQESGSNTRSEKGGSKKGKK